MRRREAPDAAAMLRWQAPALAFAGLYAFRHQRHTVLFAILAAPVLTVAAERARRALLARWPALAPRPRVLGAIAAGAALLAGVQLHAVADEFVHTGWAIHYPRMLYPVDAVEFMRVYGIHGN